MFVFSFGLVLFELLLTRLFGVVLFASFAHLALALALLGISVGALAQHVWPALVPEEGLERRLAWLLVGMGAATLLAVWLTTAVPVTLQSAEPPKVYQDRSYISWTLLNTWWFAALLPVLAAPFAIAGLAFAGTFQRRKEDIGVLYGADLLGGAVAAVCFVPVLSFVPGPDVVFGVAALAALGGAGLFWSAGDTRPARIAAVAGVVGLALVGVASGRDGILRVRYAAGYSEQNVTYTRWTPLTRLAIHEDERGHFMLLDNSSASEIVRDAVRVRALVSEPNRGLVYQLHDPPARVAIIAASAGPELAVAQSLGYTGVEAIDIAPELGDVVAERYADNPVNPYANGDTQRVVMDGRAAILHSDHPYDIIQMAHANLHSSAGQLANAWSSALLETQEAFETYLDRLDPDGTISFGTGSKTRYDVRAMVEAMRARGISEPERNVVWIDKPVAVALGKLRPWRSDELAKIRRIVGARGGEVRWDPLAPDPAVWAQIESTALLTDDRPYLESPSAVLDILGGAVMRLVGRGPEQVTAAVVLYHSLVLQALFVSLVGLACVLVPWATRRMSDLGGLRGAGWTLTYVACLGYGYLAVETVLIHQLALFVGHPTYAITVVLFAMLAASGAGAWSVHYIPQDRVAAALRAALAAVVGLGLLQAYVVPDLLDRFALGLPLAVRVLLVFVALAPLGWVMGMPFPLALRRLDPSAAAVVPWAWALNGWTSVVASIATVLVSRLLGYDAAFAVALSAYVGALALAGGLGATRVAPE